jgi:hypothetical protein
MIRIESPKFLRVAGIAAAVIAFAHMPSNSSDEHEAKIAPVDVATQCQRAIEQAAGGIKITLRGVI